MRVLQVGSSLYDWGGIERYLLYLRDGLTERGHAVECVVPRGSPLDRRLGGVKHHIALRGQFRFGRLPAYVRLFRRQRYEVVHIHFSPDFIVPALGARLARQPFVAMTRHVAVRWSAAKVRRYLKLFDHIIAVSDAVARILRESGVPAERVTVAKAGCPAFVPTLEARKVRTELGIEGFAVGFFGRLVREKGVDTLAQAAAEHPDLRFEIFGQGPMEDDLKRHAHSMGVADRVRFHGFREDVPNVLAAVDAVVVPSIWEEAFPYAVLEAMSLGRPVLASRVGGLPEMVEDGATGFLFEPGNGRDLATKADLLRGDSALRGAMGEAALQRHRTEFTVEWMARRIEAVYRAQGDLRVT